MGDAPGHINLQERRRSATAPVKSTCPGVPQGPQSPVPRGSTHVRNHMHLRQPPPTPAANHATRGRIGDTSTCCARCIPLRPPPPPFNRQAPREHKHLRQHCHPMPSRGWRTEATHWRRFDLSRAHVGPKYPSSPSSTFSSAPWCVAPRRVESTSRSPVMSNPYQGHTNLCAWRHVATRRPPPALFLVLFGSCSPVT